MRAISTRMKNKIKVNVKILTAVCHDESRQTGERLVGGDKKAAIIERLDFIMFYMMTSSLLPILD